MCWEHITVNPWEIDISLPFMGSPLISPVVCRCWFHSDSAARYWKWKKKPCYFDKQQVLKRDTLCPPGRETLLQDVLEKEIWWSFDFPEPRLRSYESVQFPCCIPTEEQTGKFHHQHRWKWLRCVKKAEVSVFISVKEAERRRRREGERERGAYWANLPAWLWNASRLRVV